MKKVEVNKYLMQQFREAFRLKKFKKHKYGLICNLNSLNFYFGYSLAHYDLLFFSGFSYSISASKIDNIYSIIEGQKETMVNLFSNSQIRLFDEGKYPVLEYDIKNEEDAQKMVEEVSAYILNEVLPEWEASPTLEYLEQKVNEKLSDIPNFSGLILAKLVNISRYEEVKKHFIDISQGWGETDKKDLKQIIAFLDNHSTEELKLIAEGKI